MAELSSLVQRLEVAVNRLESMSGPGGSAGESAGNGPGLVVTTFLKAATPAAVAAGLFTSTILCLFIE